MPGVRRIVTGTDATGRSVVVEDGPTPRAHDFAAVPGMSTALVWAAAGGTPWRAGEPDPTLGADPDEPAAGEVRFLVIRFPPDAVFAAPGFDPAAADEEQRLVSPRLHARFTADRRGMHTTETTDYVTVVEGEIHAELDDGVLVALGAGDTLVQNGARHAWRNLGDRDAVIAVVMVGRT